jgi:hypothetical protein
MIESYDSGDDINQRGNMEEEGKMDQYLYKGQAQQEEVAAQ